MGACLPASWPRVKPGSVALVRVRVRVRARVGVGVRVRREWSEPEAKPS